MKSNKQRREELRKRHEKKVERAAAPGRERLLADIDAGRAIPVNGSAVVSRSVMPKVPKYYRDTTVVCRDCGKTETWTATQQKWWYEVAKGEIESKAIRCRACRAIERDRKKSVREVHLAGLEAKAEMKKPKQP